MMSMHRHKRPHNRRDEQHGIQNDSRGQDQPVDKSRAQQASLAEETSGRKAHREAAAFTSISTGEPEAGE
jgi:hypothetical protein